jgi:hypothetical protein
MTNAVESLAERVSVLEKVAVNQAKQILKLISALEMVQKLSARNLENSHLLLDKLGVPR